jgi:putative oxidoreductase
MKIASTISRYLLGLAFLVFSLNFWFHFIPIPSPAQGTPAANFMFAIYGSGYLTVVKVLELTGALLLLSGKFVNLGLSFIGPIVVNILLYHFLLVGAGYELPVMLGVLALITLLGRSDYVKTLTTA